MNAQATGTDLWRHVRPQFPNADRQVYLNHAGVAPLCQAAVDEMTAVTQDCLLHGSLHYDRWMAGYEALRVATATLINAHRDEIAIVKNTSEGIATVQMGIAWQPGDKVVAFREEFPANYFPWRRLEDQGVHVEWLSVRDPLEVIDAACQGARLLSISYVQYLGGYRADLTAIGEICRRRDVFFFVDAIQGMGAFPLDVEAMNIDALAADGHKWLLGPEGCGVLYVRKSRLDEIAPVEFGWTNIAGYNDYACRDEALRPDAGRYECGTLNTVGCFGLKGAIQLILSLGVAPIGDGLLKNAQILYDGAREKGYEMHSDRLPGHDSGIVAFRDPNRDCRMLVKHLRDQGIVPAPRQGWVRMAPHFYQSPDEMRRVVDALPRL